jgi:hypothetical protein
MPPFFIALVNNSGYNRTVVSEVDKIGIQKWGKITLITAMISNYNMVLDIWRTRNDLIISVRGTVLDGVQEGYRYIETSKLRSEIGDQKLLQLVDLTEKAIIYTDDLIVELYDFLVNFPVYAKSRINYKLIKDYQNIVMADDTKDLYIQKYIEKSPDADYSSVVDLYGMNLETLKIMYSRLYK